MDDNMSAIKKIEASQIPEGALTIVLQEGITALSVRKLVKALSIPVSPITKTSEIWINLSSKY